MKDIIWDVLGGEHEVDLFVIMFEDTVGGFWYPRVYNTKEIGEMLLNIHHGIDVPSFKVFDADADGNLHECEIVSEQVVYDANDWGDAIWKIVSRGEVSAVASARIDGRA